MIKFIKAPNPDWLPFLELILDHAYSFLCLLIVAGLITITALGDVTKEHSYGLDGLVAIVGGLALAEKITQKRREK